MTTLAHEAPGRADDSRRRAPARPALVRAGVAALLAAHYALALSGAWNTSPTHDEPAHLAAGYAYWVANDYRLQPENGNLPQRLAALPLVLSRDVAFPPLDQPAWRDADVWALGDQFLHGSGNDVTALLRRSRAVMALLGVALCLAVFLWARSLFGTAGGFAALALCAFSPIVLAHAPLATSDVCATLFFLLAARSLWALLQRVTLRGLLGCSAAVAGLALSKTSAALFLPVAALMVPAALLRTRELPLAIPGRGVLTIRGAPRRLAASGGALLACLLFAWGAVWLAYGCRYAPFPPEGAGTFEGYLFPGAPIRTLPQAAAAAGLPGSILDALGRHRLLPEAFLYGAAYVFASAHHYAFLNGEISVRGWRLFFPYCFLVKSTLPLLLLCLTGVAAWAAALGARVRRGAPAGGGVPASAPLWILLAVFVPALILSTINIGARHMLPVWAALCVLLGGLARREARPAQRLLVAALLLWHAAEGLRSHPHHLAYFNQITGRRDAWRHLVDSNLDWGQDLPGLRKWLDRRPSRGPAARVYLAYFGTGSPAAYGIAAEPLRLEDRAAAGLPPAPGAGVYCVSATELQAVYHPARGRWSTRYEEAYQALARSGGSTEGLDPRELGWLADTTGVIDAERSLLVLGTARLLAHLRGREPVANVGFSILCFELTDADVERALSGPPPELAAPWSPEA